MGITIEAKRIARKAAKANNNCPVEIVGGNIKPKKVGTEWHYETKGGTWINYPGAYSTSGWSNMVYCPSTIRVQVGAKWLEKKLNNKEIFDND